MPEDKKSYGQSPALSRGIEAVTSWLENLGGTPRALTSLELRAYPDRRIQSGWRLEVAFPDRTRAIDILIDYDFPRTPPRIAVVDRPPFLAWPHIEKDGVLCVLPEGAEVDPHAPEEVVRHVLKLSVELIEESLAGLNLEDFREEFLSYWNRSLTENAPKLRSLLKVDPTSRVVKVWRGRDFYLIADSESDAKIWLERSYRSSKNNGRRFEDALFFWIERPLLPEEYPKSGANLRRIIGERAPDGLRMLESLVASQPDQVVVVLGARTKNGPCLAGIVVRAPQMSGPGRPKNPLSRGFRPDRVPKSLVASRYLGSGPVTRASVERADAAWIHGRDQDIRFPRLRASRVAILGCGSVGAAVAVKLAEAGVGSLLLVDPETLSQANVGRHPLGAGSVGSYKAIALAKRITSDFPHINDVNASVEKCESLLAREPEKLASQDLIVSAMGSWSAEGRLNDWHVAHGRPFPIVYGWTEAHASAGHAVLVTNEGGCFGCGVGPFGNPLLRVTDWPEGTTQRNEPACGAVFQPYGPVELSHIVALIAELSIDSLLDPGRAATHRIWAARSQRLVSIGGTWTRDWLCVCGERSEGGFVFERTWMPDDRCLVCRAEAA